LSVLIVGGAEEVVGAVIQRLVSVGDDVRVVENDARLGEAWRSLGAHVARGEPLDADLFERAAQHCRTLVLIEDGSIIPEAMEDALEGASLARVERTVLLAARRSPQASEALRTTTMEYVLLTAGARKGLLRRPAWSVAPGRLAEAIDAADDIGGEVRLELDLSDAAAWAELGLNPP
jgi:uncharacterized protein YbjT (DUF2867 family)